MAYKPTSWTKGMVLDAENLNNMESGIAGAWSQLNTLTGQDYDGSDTPAPTGLRVTGNLTAGGTLSVTGNSTLHNTTVSGTLTATGNTAIQGTLTVGTTSAVKQTILNGALNVTGATTLTNTLTIGTSTATREVKIYGPLIVSGSMTLNNNSVATQQYVTDAINNLNVSAVTGAQSKTLTQISEINGKISATFNDILITENQVSSLTSHLNQKAPLASPAFTGTPTATTATAGTNNTQIATTAFVNTAIINATSNLTSSITGTAVGKTLTSLSQTDGIISAEFGDIAINGTQITVDNVSMGNLVTIDENNKLTDSGVSIPPSTLSPGIYTLQVEITSGDPIYSWVPVSQGE